MTKLSNGLAWQGRNPGKTELRSIAKCNTIALQELSEELLESIRVATANAHGISWGFVMTATAGGVRLSPGAFVTRRGDVVEKLDREIYLQVEWSGVVTLSVEATPAGPYSEGKDEPLSTRRSVRPRLRRHDAVPSNDEVVVGTVEMKGLPGAREIVVSSQGRQEIARDHNVLEKLRQLVFELADRVSNLKEQRESAAKRIRELVGEVARLGEALDGATRRLDELEQDLEARALLTANAASPVSLQVEPTDEAPATAWVEAPVSTAPRGEVSSGGGSREVPPSAAPRPRARRAEYLS